MKLLPRLLASVALLCALPAYADTALTSSWTKIASAPGSFEFQNSGGAPILVTTSAGTPSGSAQGEQVFSNDHRCWSVTSDLYARALGGSFATGTVSVFSGVSCSGAASTAPVSIQDGTAPSGWSTPQSAAAAGVLSSVIDTQGYNSIEFGVSGTFSATATVQVSDDPTFATFSSQVGQASTNAGVAEAATIGNPGSYSFPVRARYMRFNVAYTSGSMVVTAVLRQTPFTPRAMYLTGGTVTATPLKAASTVTPGTTSATPNAFTTLLASNTARNGCKVANTSTNPEFVYVGGGTAAVNASFQVAAGGVFDCATPAGVVITDLLSIASGTASQSFVVVSQ